MNSEFTPEELEKMADEWLREHPEEDSEYPILSPRKLRKRQETEIPFSEVMLDNLTQEGKDKVC